MKPLSIADYLDHLGRPAGDKTPARPEGSPFRARSLPGPQNNGLGPKPIMDRRANAGVETKGEEAARRAPWAPKPILLESGGRQSPPVREPVEPENMSVKLTEAHARGREEGLAEGRLEASGRHATELVAAREQAEAQQQAFRLNEYAEIESVVRSGLQQMEDNVGAAVTRILAPFLSQEILKRAVGELAKSLARISSSASPGLIKIRGPERVLALLRARIADLPIEVEYVEDAGVETIVQANATQIVAELRPWTELLASFEA
jgi:hypothetical protein